MKTMENQIGKDSTRKTDTKTNTKRNKKSGPTCKGKNKWPYIIKMEKQTK